MSDTNTIVETRGFDDIATNLLFSIPVALALFAVFCLFRSKYRAVFAPNINSHVQLGSGTGWISTVWGMDDRTLLSVTGMDGFVTIQMVKMIWLMLFVLGIPMLAFLLPLYYLTRTSIRDDPSAKFGEYLFYNLSIMVLPPSLLWIPMLVCYVATVIMFYFVYSFYRAFLLQRQVFLEDAAALSGFVRMRSIVSAFGGDIERAREYVNCMHKAVILSGVSAKYSELDVKQLVGVLGDIQSAHFVHSRDKLKQSIDKRTLYLTRLEAAYADFYQAILRHLRNIIKAETGESDQHVDELLQKFEAALSETTAISMDRRCHLMMQIHDSTFMSQCRPKHIRIGTKKTPRPAHTRQISTLSDDAGSELVEEEDGGLQQPPSISKDAIIYMHQAVLEKDRRCGMRLEEFVSEADDDILIDRRATRVGLQSAVIDGNNLDLERNTAAQPSSITDPSLASMRRFVAVWRNLKEFKLALWGTSRSVIVVFKEVSSATLARQAVLSRRPLSMRTRDAPAADDLLWSNLYLPPADRSLRHLGGDIMYVFLNIIFLSTAIFIGSLLQLEQLERTFPFLEPALNLFPASRTIIRGILAPLGLTLSFLVVPYALHALALYQGKVSKTEVDGWVIVRYAWFLVIQLSVIGFFPNSNFLKVIQDWSTGDWKQNLTALQSNLPYKAVLFINATIQRTCISLFLQLSKPWPLILAIVSGNKQTPREQCFPPVPPLAIRTIYPELLLFVYLMCMAFMLVTPIFIVPGLFFFGVAYFTLRYQLIYSDAILNESGGLYWRLVSGHILAGMPMAQIFLLFQLLINGRTLESILMLPLMLGTYFAIRFLENVFEQKSRFRAVTGEDTANMHALLQDIQRRQTELLRIPENHLTNFNMVPIRFNASTSACDADMTNAGNPYVDPLLIKRHQCACLPPTLLPLTQFLIDTPSITRDSIERFIAK